MTMNIKEYNIFVDFGNGDKFHISDFDIDETNKKIILKGKQGQMTWIKLNALHPISIKH